jgi:hypothetical protein
MDILNSIQSIFSNREIALLIWILVIIFSALFFKGARSFLITAKEIFSAKHF